ncbi:helix-turn-helix domain-containing protein [Dysgonomonas sp. 520]|uniref:helix-turn-helix domain-containing protein n=1 Tax=Dysgonomonas sp. 520 TaxID=2302931 RepID=UPI0013D0E56A|nr:helix-turn-helix domain-containing protein [Dysgonomonas sp. 520]NDW08806.1 AraC family transcriptional regulator [Dysgonomonas sp. 520]
MNLNDKLDFEKQGPLIEFLSFKENSEWKTKDHLCRIVLIRKGSLELSFDYDRKATISCSKLFFLPPNYGLTIKVLEDSSLLLVTINDENYFDNLRIDDLRIRNREKEEERICFLDMDNVLLNYIHSLQVYENNGIRDISLHILKIKELMCILKAFYSPDELNRFFSLYRSNDLYFSKQVYNLSQNIQSARQLAQALHYSYSGFNKRFRKVFGISAYLWLRQRRARAVYYELYHTDKSLKQISTDNKFNTLSHFNEFCHKILGDSPRQIRNRRCRKQNTEI